jgi:hypothetical protein
LEFDQVSGRCKERLSIINILGGHAIAIAIASHFNQVSESKIGLTKTSLNNWTSKSKQSEWNNLA